MITVTESDKDRELLCCKYISFSFYKFASFDTFHELHLAKNRISSSD